MYFSVKYEDGSVAYYDGTPGFNKNESLFANGQPAMGGDKWVEVIARRGECPQYRD
ncbi:hypothetical protein [Mycobacteroides chelonae]|uniref:hypothetical protein n=1 Tax=Mycobacteroides chelonae TaxID=1774 RepID=UPI003AADC12D